MAEDEFLKRLPKAELHLHIEGTLEPALMMSLAAKNGVKLPYATVEEAAAAYRFDSLQSFLDVYYLGASVLLHEEDFYALMRAYLRRAAGEEGVRHAEIFFDPQTHTERGVPFGVFMKGFKKAQQEVFEEYGTSSMLIMCFLRHLSCENAMQTLEEAGPFLEDIVGVGLDSSEVGNPPSKFVAVFKAAREKGLRVVAHAGEEGDSSYIWGALDLLGAERIDHGVRCEEDEALLARLAAEQVPLTMCPCSNLKLKVIDSMDQHNLRRLLAKGLLVTVNSDDPSYFGGYLCDNYRAVRDSLALTREELVQLARNSISASFLPQEKKAALLQELSELTH